MGERYLKNKVRGAFRAKRHLTDPKEVEKQIAFGDYIVSELKALYFLKRYRTLKSRYEVQDDSNLVGIIEEENKVEKR